MKHLDPLIQEAVFVLREARANFRNPILLWSMGKDSTVVLDLARKAFMGDLPTVLHVDTTFKFPEMYEFRSRMKEEWNIPLQVYTNTDAIASGVNYDNYSPVEVCHQLKTVPLREYIEKNDVDCVIVGIRRDEDGSRNKERFFSIRGTNHKWNHTDQDSEVWNFYTRNVPPGCHVRCHPLLNWDELHVWEYVKYHNVPLPSLYFSNEGKRYRSLGCVPITKPIDSTASNIDEIIEELKTTKTRERDGRQQDKESEYALQKLRERGYM